MKPIWDRIGISASLVCAAHCLITPALVVFVPFLGEVFSAEIVHVVVLLVVVPVAVWALWQGYRVHRQKRIIWLGLLGLTFIFLSQFISQHNDMVEVVGMVIAGFVLAAAHLFNLRACQVRHH